MNSTLHTQFITTTLLASWNAKKFFSISASRFQVSFLSSIQFPLRLQRSAVKSSLISIATYLIPARSLRVFAIDACLSQHSILFKLCVVSCLWIMDLLTTSSHLCELIFWSIQPLIHVSYLTVDETLLLALSPGWCIMRRHISCVEIPVYLRPDTFS